VYKARFITCFKANPGGEKNLLYETGRLQFGPVFSAYVMMTILVAAIIAINIHVPSSLSPHLAAYRGFRPRLFRPRVPSLSASSTD
jgi:hypothetical protein